MKCLIIDDDQSCIDTLESKLKDQYGNVELDIFQKPPHIDELQTDYDLFFIDVLLGKESGIECANSIKDYYPHMTLVFLSYQDNLIFETQKISPICFIRKSNFDEDFQMFCIVYVECYSHELIIHTHNNEYIVKMTLKEFLNKVKKLNSFVQVHRAYVINMKYIYLKSKTMVQMFNEDSKNAVPISRRYKRSLDKAYGEFLLS